MRIDVDAGLATAAHQRAIDESIEAHEAKATRALERILRKYVRQGVASFQRGHLVAITAAGDYQPPSWRVPIANQLIDETALQAELDDYAKDYADAVATTTATGMAAALGIEFNQSNRLLHGVIAGQSGSRITTAPEDLTRTMMTRLQKSYDDGESIPKAARAMREVGYMHSRGYAERIARTELIGAVNASSLAQVQGATTISFKFWMATADGRTRDSHAEADGQTVPTDAAFEVGGARLEYPGDSSGPAEEVVNCRCTLGYTDEPSIAAGGIMAAVDTTEEQAALTGAAWTGIVAQEGVDTGDGRRIAEGALNWRELPLTLMAQHTTPDMGGHAEAQVAGRVDALARDGQNIIGSGVFDTGSWGAETQRLVSDGMLKGVSIDLSVNELEIIPPEDPADEIEAMFGGTMNVLDGTILGMTVVPFPAFENANIAIVAGAAMRLTNAHRDESGTYVVTFFMPFAPFPVAKDDAPPADSEGDSGGGDAAAAIADVKDAVDGHPGLDGQVVITIDGQDTTVKFPSGDAEKPKPTPDAEASAVREALALIRDHFEKGKR